MEAVVWIVYFDKWSILTIDNTCMSTSLKRMLILSLSLVAVRTSRICLVWCLVRAIVPYWWWSIRQDTARQDRTQDDKTRHRTPRQDQSKQHRQDKTRQDKTRHGKARQDNNTRQHKRVQGRARPDRASEVMSLWMYAFLFQVYDVSCISLFHMGHACLILSFMGPLVCMTCTKLSKEWSRRIEDSGLGLGLVLGWGIGIEIIMPVFIRLVLSCR